MEKTDVYLVFGSLVNANESNVVTLNVNRVPNHNEEILYNGEYYKVFRVATEYKDMGGVLVEYIYIFLYLSELKFKLD